jgi:3-deoxy-D-manno-octulosonate 8-phosphate phosphatase (KDO 8-P phosphatase)
MKDMDETPVLGLFKQVKHFIFDIDGVLTNGTLLIHPDGTLLRTMNIRDGYALQWAVKKQYGISIISGAKGDALFARLKALGIQDIHLGIEDKLSCLQELTQTKQLDLKGVLYMGDDMPDLKVMQEVLIPSCPADAIPEIVAVSKYVSPCKGGEGCVRDVIEKVLKLNGHWLPD